MIITVKDKTDPHKVRFELSNAINHHSRFIAEIEVKSIRQLKIRNIRLKENQKYCGNHPLFCEQGNMERARNARYLQGLDWVSVNDLINDVLDSLGCSANVYSSVCIIRKLERRRMHYGSHTRQFSRIPEWNRDEPNEFYEDWRNKIAPNSTYPMGPGIYTRDFHEMSNL